MEMDPNLLLFSFARFHLVLSMFDFMLFYQCLQEDPTTRRWLQQLLHNVGVNRVPTLQAGAGFDHMLVS